MQLAKAAFLATLSSASSIRKLSQYEMPTLLTQPALQNEASLLDLLIAANGDDDFLIAK